VVIMDGCGVEEVRAVQASSEGATEVLDAGVVIGVGPAPLLHDGQQRREVGVVDGGAADQDGAAAAGSEDVRAEAADEQIAATPAVQDIVASAPYQDVVGDAAAGVEGVVA